MVDRTSRRRGGTNGSSRSRGGGQPKPLSKGKELLNDSVTEMASPVLEKYGIPALDELFLRIDVAINEFKEEVDSLFTEMVDQSREDHGRLKSLLGKDEQAEEEPSEEVAPAPELSEIERRLEGLEGTSNPGVQSSS